MKSIRHKNKKHPGLIAPLWDVTNKNKKIVITPKLITRNYEIAQRRDEEQTFQAIEERIREQLHEAGAASLFKITKLKRVETDTDDCNLVFYTFDLKTFEDDHEKYINYTSINGGADVKTDI